MGFIIIGLLFFSIDYIPDSLLKDVQNKKILIASLMIPFGLLNIYLSSILLGSDRTKEVGVLWILAPSTLILYLIVLTIFFQTGVMGAVSAWILSTMSVTVFSVIFVGRRVKLRLKMNVHFLKKSLVYGLKAHLGTCTQFLNYRLDMFFVQYFLGFTQLGYYSLAVAFSELLWDIPYSVSTALFPKVSSSSMEEASSLTPKICRNTVFVMIILSLGVFVFCEIIIRIAYSQVFLPSVVPLRILLPGIVILSISKVLSGDLSGRGMPIFSTRASIASLFLNVPLNFFLIPKWGIAGAAFASTVSYTAQTFIVIYYFVKISKNRVFDTLIIKPADFHAYRSLVLEQLNKLVLKKNFFHLIRKRNSEALGYI
ncbi:MAG: polysaccharide biosynthesis C-terminal domain-containing protein [Gemmatimonadota bacterium]|nr:MAG: polysaccharide biosynthesis C-terminal domain-containing protein [Gemmatimonadota bacterium]